MFHCVYVCSLKNKYECTATRMSFCLPLEHTTSTLILSIIACILVILKIYRLIIFTVLSICKIIVNFSLATILHKCLFRSQKIVQKIWFPVKKGKKNMDIE